MAENDDKKYLFLEAMIRFAEIFGNENLGTCEVDISKVICYAETEQFKLIVGWDCSTLEDHYKLIEDMVLDGFPIWHFLKLSDWTMNMLDREFRKEVQKAIEAEQLEQKKYKCYSCEYFNEHRTSLGILYECNKPKPPRERRRLRSREPFRPRKECDDFKVKESTKAG